MTLDASERSANFWDVNKITFDVAQYDFNHINYGP